MKQTSALRLTAMRWLISRAFVEIIDILGGVDIERTDDEIEYINYQMYKNKQVPTDIPSRTAQA